MRRRRDDERTTGEDVLELEVRQLDPGLPVPSYAHPGDAGLDLHAADATVLRPGERALVPTGLAVAIPAGWAGFVHPRSGLAVDHGVTVLNAPGTIDAGYRGEIRVALVNHGDAPVEIAHGQRIAQLVLMRVGRATVRPVERLTDTARGDGGFGSTGR
ncbi:MAG: dUTP diphosphatase [Nitriliruptoraceae bacterium]